MLRRAVAFSSATNCEQLPRCSLPRAPRCDFPRSRRFFMRADSFAAAGSANPSPTGVAMPAARVRYARPHFQLNTNTAPVDCRKTHARSPAEPGLDLSILAERTCGVRVGGRALSRQLRMIRQGAPLSSGVPPTLPLHWTAAVPIVTVLDPRLGLHEKPFYFIFHELRLASRRG